MLILYNFVKCKIVSLSNQDFKAANRIKDSKLSIQCLKEQWHKRNFKSPVGNSTQIVLQQMATR